MNKLLIVGEVYSSNLGDAVICDLVSKLIKEKYSSVEISYCDLSARNYYLQEFSYSLIARVFIFCFRFFFRNSELHAGIMNFLFKQKYFSNIRDKFNSFDAVLFAGGQLFMDYFYLPVRQILLYAKKFNKPVFFHAIGCKKIKSILIQKKFNKMLNMQVIKWISIRDGYGIFNFSNLRLTYDTGLCANEYYVLGNKAEEIIGLGCMYFYKLSNFENVKFWVNLIKCLNKRGFVWKLFCNGSYADYMLIINILKSLNLNFSEYSIRRPVCPDDLVKDISTFSKIISFRLHSHIIAASVGIPSVGISWDEDKCRDFFVSINHLERYKNVKDAPDEIVDALVNAQYTKADRELVNRQRKKTVTDLYNALQSNVELSIMTKQAT